MKTLITATCLFLLLTTNAHAYLGPGLGIGTIAVIGGIVLSLFLGLFSVLYYPIKRLVKKLKKSGNDSDAKL